MAKIIDSVKTKIKDNSTKLALVGLGIATLGTTYIVGRVHGLNVYLVHTDENGQGHKHEIPKL